MIERDRQKGRQWARQRVRIKDRRQRKKVKDEEKE
jgi:hypothetical protein